MIALFQKLGHETLSTLQKLGRANLFICHVITGLPQIFRRYRLLLVQVYSVGVLTVLLVSVPACLSGWCWAAGLQCAVRFRAEQTLGVMVAASWSKLGPVVCCCFDVQAPP